MRPPRCRCSRAKNQRRWRRASIEESRMKEAITESSKWTVVQLALSRELSRKSIQSRGINTNIQPPIRRGFSPSAGVQSRPLRPCQHVRPRQQRLPHESEHRFAPRHRQPHHFLEGLHRQPGGRGRAGRRDAVNSSSSREGEPQPPASQGSPLAELQGAAPLASRFQQNTT